MKWKLKFEKELFDELEQYLFNPAPLENGCFILGTVKNKIIFINDILYPSENDWIINDRNACVPSSSYISLACIKASQANKSLMFVHTHPEVGHPSTFSSIDEISNQKLFENLKDILSMPIGSLVFSLNSIHGVIYSNNAQQPIDSYTVYGKQIEILKDAIADSSELDFAQFDRQLRFMNESGLKTLANMNVAIVGLGGIGSPLAMMLSKMGIKNFSFYDNDRVEVHNLPRIVGACIDSVGEYKVDVVKKFIGTFSNALIETYPEHIDENTNMSHYDAIFGGVDNHTARDLMNKNAYSYAIPYVDAACSIPLNENGGVESAVVSVNTIMPKSSCLWCNNVLNAMKITEEGLSEEELKQREKDGYVKAIEKAPSVISLTNAVASIAANRLLNIIGVLSGEYPSKVMFDFNTPMYFDPPSSINKNCLCHRMSPFNKK